MSREECLVRAGNYVLGLAEPGERDAIARDMDVDHDLRTAVLRLVERMQALDEVPALDAPPEGLWRRIAAIAAETPQEKPAAKMAPARRGVPRSGRDMRFALGMAAALLLILGVGYLAGRLTATRPQPVVLVVLETADRNPGAVFEAYADNSVRIVMLENFAVPDGKILQVWTLYDKTVGPVSLGTLTRAGATRLGPISLPPPAADQLYEITLESAPGSPTGKPTGPILVKGYAKPPVGG
jgi:anti-sigma-K factor RskA